MPSLLHQRDRDEIVARLRRLTPEHRARWGRMTARECVCHLADQLRVALGDVVCERFDSPARRTVIKWIVLHASLPIPRGRVETVPEMQLTQPGDFAADVATCEMLVQRLVREKTQAVHPAFGPMTQAQWGILCYKHLDHHLEQFGE